METGLTIPKPIEAKTVRHAELPKNHVVGYHGGGYDGCIYEWNFAYVDNDGRFHDIYSSGRRGIVTGEALLEALNKDREDELDLYDMSDEEERNRMADSESVWNAGRIAGFFIENEQFGVEVKLKCSRCGERVKAEGCSAEGLRGGGGISIEANDIVCSDCDSICRCWYCGEYDEDTCKGEYETEDGKTVELNGQACQWCIEDFKDGRKTP